MLLALDKQGVLYEQIARALKAQILDGRLKAGCKLPSTRSLAIALGVSRKPVIQAYELLGAEQLTIPVPGSGTRVARTGSRARSANWQKSALVSRYTARLRALPAITLAGVHAGAHAGERPKYNLLYGEPVYDPSLFNSWRRKLLAAALRAGPSYPDAGGHLPLRRAIAEHLARRQKIICDTSDILVAAGTQQALTIIERVVLNPGDRVVLEDPHYQLAKHSLDACGAEIFSGRTDEQGLVVRELPQRPTRLTVVTPSHQFPSGVVMSLSRRLELLEWAAQTQSWIIEDDYDGEFDPSDSKLPALTALDLTGRVIYVGSFSKTIFPALRLGYIVCPKSLREDLFKTKLLDDLGSPTIEQAALATFIQSGQYDKHLRKSIVELAERRLMVIEALQRLAGAHIEIGPHGCGMHFVIWLHGIGFQKIASFIRYAKSSGLGLYPVHHYYTRKPDRPGLLIGFAALPIAQLKVAIELLARCLKQYSR